MSNLTSHIAGADEARLEEKSPSDLERQLLLTLAPERWADLKHSFDEECRAVSQRSHRFQFECNEPDDYHFSVNRMVGMTPVPALEFIFDPTTPRINWADHHGGRLRGSLDLVPRSSQVYFMNGPSGVILPEFVTNLMKRITR